MYAVGWGFGEIGGPDRPWIHLAYPGALLQRAGAGAHRRAHRARRRAGGGAVRGFLFRIREYWHDPLTTLSLSFVASLVALVVAVGHLSFRIMRQSFYQSLELERASTELADLNETLESRVREQTRDLRRLTDHLERAREDERTRISRELHDRAGPGADGAAPGAAALGAALRQGSEVDLGQPRQRCRRCSSARRRRRATSSPSCGRSCSTSSGCAPGIEWLIRQTEQRSRVALHADRRRRSASCRPTSRPSPSASCRRR